MNELAQQRLQTVYDHMALECEGDWDAVIDTFAHPRYEMYGTGTVHDGEQQVRQYFAASRTPFPDQGNEIISIAAGDNNTVHVEFWLTGTHLGPLKIGSKIIDATHKKFKVRMAATFEFAENSNKIICERPYFDQTSVLRALDIKF